MVRTLFMLEPTTSYEDFMALSTPAGRLAIALATYITKGALVNLPAPGSAGMTWARDVPPGNPTKIAPRSAMRTTHDSNPIRAILVLNRDISPMEDRLLLLVSLITGCLY